MTAFVDLPDDRFDLGVSFWMNVTQAGLSAPRGADGQFATLVPPDGDPYVRVQRTGAGPRIHLDLHVEYVAKARETAEHLGATVDLDLGYVVMTSPSGMPFCIVSHHGETTRPAPVTGGREHRLDQVCIDVPAPLFERETDFWHALTGWHLHRGQLEEFALLSQPSNLPLRLVLQRLGGDDAAGAARAHLDIACGHGVEAVRQVHERFGAEFVARGLRWTTMRDPAGLLYCLTQRDPTTGRIAD